MKLVCFPYAGGSASIYTKWNHFIDCSIDIIPFELPGRGIRFGEELCDNMDRLIEDIYKHLKDMFEIDDYMLYGHSMGSWIVYYLGKMIQKNKNRIPYSLFLSGRHAPHIQKSNDISYLMDDDEIINRIYALGGTPKEFMENSELSQIYIPIIRNDLKLLASCKIENSECKFDCDITVFNGLQDTLIKEDIIEWNQYTNQNFKFYQFDGGHFFINQFADKMLTIISKQVKIKSYCI